MRLLIDHKGGSYLVSAGNDLHTKYGYLKAEELEGAFLGQVLKSNTGSEFRVLEPDILDFIAKAKRGPQAVTLKDMALICAYAGINSASKVVEAGTGSGLLSMYLAHIVYPEKLTTYELRDDFAKIAEKNFEKFGIKNIILKNQDIYEGMQEDLLDAIIFDLPEPWLALPDAKKKLKVGGRIVSYSPSVNQMHRFSEELGQDYMQQTFECIMRNWKPTTMRPDTRMLGHTGFLVVARKTR